MAIDFPTSPATNDTYTYANRTWKFNGTSWDFIQANYLTTFSNANFVASTESVNIVASAPATTINFDILTASTLFYTVSNTANFTINFRGSSTATLDSILAVNESITVTLLVTNSSTAYYMNGAPPQVDATTTNVTIAWQNGLTPTSGNPSGTDAYSFTIVKTAQGSPSTYKIFASVVKFA
jgi:hypothetical protein